MKEQLSVRNLVAVGIGAAVFFILGRFASIPTGIPSTNVETSYAFLAMLAAAFGPLVGMLAGFIGHALKDLSYGGVWWSWVITSGVFGAGVGLACMALKVKLANFDIKQMVMFNLAQILVNAVCWGLLAPVLDILIYAEPSDLVFTQGLVAGSANAVTILVLGTALLLAYSKTMVKAGSLKKEA